MKTSKNKPGAAVSNPEIDDILGILVHYQHQPENSQSVTKRRSTYRPVSISGEIRLGQICN